MATVQNTITLRDRMSAIITRISDRMRRLGQDSRNAGDQSQRSFRQMVDGARSAASSFSAFGASIVTLNQGLQLLTASLESAKKITDVADEYTSINARLGNILESGQTVVDMQNQIYDAAERSHGSYRNMAASVAKMALLAQDAFKGNNEEVVAFTESLQKSFAVSGASTQEQIAGIYQITQALSAGKLQGDEFRSVMENAPMFAQAISKYTGQTIGQLKLMSAEGTITSDIMKNAMFQAADEINKKFAAMPMTFAGAWQIGVDKALRSLEPFMTRMSDWLNSGGADRLTEILGNVASAAEVLGNMLFWIIDHFRIISSIVIGMAVPMAILAGAMLYFGVTTWWANSALVAFVAEMGLATFGLSIIIGAIVTGIAYWIQSVGGLKIAWAIFYDYLLYVGEGIYTGFIVIKNGILNFMDGLRIVVMDLTQQMEEHFHNMVIGILGHITNLVNGAITLLNPLIKGLNFAGLTDIHEIDLVANYQEKINKQNQNFAADTAQRKQDMAIRDMKSDWATDSLSGNHAERQAKINEMKAANAAGANGANKPPDQNVPKGTPSDPISTKQKGDITISDEDLKYMRDLARVKFINKYTTMRPQVNNTFGDIRETADVNKIVAHIAGIIEESTSAALS